MQPELLQRIGFIADISTDLPGRLVTGALPCYFGSDWSKSHSSHASLLSMCHICGWVD